MPIDRPTGRRADGALVLVDATSAAGGLRFDPTEFDVYYFAPQKCLASDGGLWLAAVLARGHRAHRADRRLGDRWVPASLDLGIALDNSRKDQTYNTPALATLFLATSRSTGSTRTAASSGRPSRCDRSAEAIYGWAEASSYATPFVKDPAERSHVVATIDLDAAVVDANVVSQVLRANGIVDTETYRKLGRNQLRVALFPAIDPDDVTALTRCIDHVVAALA